MKDSESQKQKTARTNRSQKPFFRTGSKHSFFSSDQPVQQSPFFKVSGVQAKLTVGAVGDKYEQEADRVAANVVARINDGPPVQTRGEQTRGEQTVVQRMEEEENLQMKPMLQRGGHEGGEVPTDFESGVQSARGKGQALAPELQTQMGQAMGANFSGVRMHTDAQSDQLTQRIQAKAFTTGQDVFFRQGAYQPGSRSGQTLIAHELTHVVQQGAGKATAYSQNSGLFLQRKDYYIGKPNTPLFDYEDDNKIASHSLKATLPINTQVKGADGPEYRGIHASEEDEAEYTKLNSPNTGVVHKDNLRADKKSRSGAWDVLEAGGDFYNEGASVYDARAGSLDRGALREKDSSGYKVDKSGNTETKDWQEKHGADVVSGSYETIGNIISIATTLRKWKQRNNEEKVSDVFDTAQTGLSTVATVTKVVDSGGKLNKDNRSGLGKEITVHGPGRTENGGSSYQTNQSDLAGKVTGNIADLGGLIVNAKDLFFKGKKLWETWKENRKQEGSKASKGDVARAGIDLGITLVSTIKDVISTARNLLFTLENAWHGGLSSAVPGLGIAIGGLKIIVSIWNIVKADKHRAKMREFKRKWKEQLGQADNDKLNNTIIASMKAEIQQRIEADRPKDSDSRKLKLIQEYELQKELQTINRKRIDRQILHISTGITAIAGDIATLSGVGATAGVGLKAAASGTELGAQGLRKIKQFGRDRANKPGAWKVTQAIFNKDKNSKAKKEKREGFANMIYDMIIALADKVNKGEEVDDDEILFSRIKAYFRAAGLSWKAWLETASADPDKGHRAIMKALAERE